MRKFVAAGEEFTEQLSADIRGKTLRATKLSKHTHTAGILAEEKDLRGRA